MDDRLRRCLAPGALRVALVLDDEAVTAQFVGMGKIEIALVLCETVARALARRMPSVQQAGRGDTEQ
jgi:hypothetical protein